MAYGQGGDRFAGATYDPTSHYRAAAVFDFFRARGLTPPLLREVSRLLIVLARQGDTVARWGGEEFVVVLPETDLAGAQRFAERLRRTIGSHAVGEMKTTTSCGVATMLPEDSVEELLGAADKALYQAKSNGRNRTESAVRRPRPAVA